MPRPAEQFIEKITHDGTYLSRSLLPLHYLPVGAVHVIVFWSAETLHE